MVVALNIIGRTAGKWIGAFGGAKLSHSHNTVRKFLGFALFFQPSGAIGLALDIYQNIIHQIKDGKKIFIFSQGEAKIELAKEIKKTNDLAPKIIAIESADKMTDHQIAAKTNF